MGMHSGHAKGRNWSKGCGDGGTINRVLASTGLASRGSFRGPGVMGPTPFGRMGVGGNAVGIGLPTGSVIALRLRWFGNGCLLCRGRGSY